MYISNFIPPHAEPLSVMLEIFEFAHSELSPCRAHNASERERHLPHSKSEIELAVIPLSVIYRKI
jgi:hypothetical protein